MLYLKVENNGTLLIVKDDRFVEIESQPVKCPFAHSFSNCSVTCIRFKSERRAGCMKAAYCEMKNTEMKNDNSSNIMIGVFKE
jgi:hypothetical protein